MKVSWALYITILHNMYWMCELQCIMTKIWTVLRIAKNMVVCEFQARTPRAALQQLFKAGRRNIVLNVGQWKCRQYLNLQIALAKDFCRNSTIIIFHSIAQIFCMGLCILWNWQLQFNTQYTMHNCSRVSFLNRQQPASPECHKM